MGDRIVMRWGLLLLLGACASAPARPVARQLGAAPLVRADRAPTTLAEITGGRPAVVELFATWCDVCRRQVPELDALSRELGDRGVVVGVVLGEEPAPLRGWGIGYPVLFDPRLAFADAHGVSSVPTLLVVDAQGRVRHVGRTLDAPARRAIADVVGAPPAARALDSRPPLR